MKKHVRWLFAVLVMLNFASAKNFSDYFTEVEKIVLSPGNILTGRLFLPFWQTIDVNKNGEFLICDVSGKKVYLFDKTGKMKRVIMNTGNGPGEVEQPICVRILEKENEILVMDAITRKITFLNGVYDYERSFVIKSNHTQPRKIVDCQNLLIASAYTENWAEGTINEGQTMVLYKKNGEYIKSFYYINDYARGTIIGYEGLQTVFFVSGKKIYAAQASDYKIHVFNLNGDEVHQFGVEPVFYKRAPRSTLFKTAQIKSNEQYIREADKYKDKMPFIYLTNIIGASKHIFVQYELNKPGNLDEVKNKLEVYDYNGKKIDGNIDTPYTFWTKGEDGYYYFIEKEIFTENNTRYVVGKFKEKKQ